MVKQHHIAVPRCLALLALSLFMLPYIVSAQAHTMLKCQQYQPSMWLRTCPGGVFCFKHPSTFQSQPVIAVDSLSGVLVSDSMKLHYDVGQYINDYSHDKGVKRQSFSIDAGEGELIITNNKVAFIIDDIQPTVPLSLELSLKQHLTGKRKVDIVLAKCIVSTLSKR